MEDSIFNKIIKGEIPCHKVYEDEHTLAFLDIHPAMPGLTLVVPKKQVGFVWDMDSADYQALMLTVQKVGQRLREVLPEYDRVGVHVEGLDISDHAHVKVFPFDTHVDFTRHADMEVEPDHQALSKMAELLHFS